MQIAKKYAKALYKEAMVTKMTDKVLSEITALSSAIFLQAEVARAVASRSRKQSVENLMLKVMNKYNISALTSNFIRLVIRLKRVKFLPQMVEEFERMTETAGGLKIVDIVSAKEVNKAEKAELEEVIKGRFGERILAKYSVDPSIIGGVVAYCDSAVFDASIKGATERILAG